MESLQVGQQYKNYKTLCSVLGEPEKQGNSKRAQLKNWQRYFSYERQGHQFLITAVFPSVKPPQDKRTMGNHNKYIYEIEPILLSKLQKDGPCDLTKNNFYALLGMAGDDFLHKRYQTVLLSHPQITLFDINHFFQRTNQKLERILFSSLQNLKRRGLIDFYEQVIVVSSDDRGHEYHRFATEYEIREIENCKHQILRDMGVPTLTHVFLKFLSREFYMLLNQQLKQFLNIEYSYRQYHIFLPYTFSACPDVQKHKMQLNSLIREAIDQQAHHNFEKNQMEYQLEVKRYLQTVRQGGNMPFSFFRYQDNYIANQTLLSDVFLKI